jgi:esterase
LVSDEVARTLPLPDGSGVAYRLLPAASGASGRVLILIHGLASNLTRWSEFVEHTSLKQRWDLLRVDLRGHGDSLTRGPIGLKLWCEDLQAILNAERHARAVFVGHSLGAQVVLQFAARYPEQVAGLVLIDPVFRQALRGNAVWLRRFGPILRVAAECVRLLNALGVRRRHLGRLDLRQLDEQAREALRSPGGARRFVRHYSSPLADLRYIRTAHYLQELADLFAPLPPLEAMQSPVLVLLSRATTFADFNQTKALARRFPLGRVVTLDAYHWPLTERPVEVRRAIEEWCGHLGMY